MRIGVATWFGAGNFGTDLQCYAFCRYLQKRGHKVYLIYEFRYTKLGFLKKTRFFLGKIKRLFFKNIELNIIKEYKEKYLPIYPFVITRKDYNKLLNDFDCFFSGSDQIWNPYHFSSFYLLDFANSKPRFAYASSVGVSEIPQEKHDIYKHELKNFKFIGVREKTGVDAINKILGENKAVQVLDPTFLMLKEEWKSFAKKVDMPGIYVFSYMFVYVIGNREIYSQYIQRVQQHYNIQYTICVKSAEGGYYAGTTLGFDRISPMQFVYLLMNARLICTDSFHATALCINMNQNFIELTRFDDNDERSQNSRIYDLLNHYSLYDRLYKGGKLPDEKVDFEVANMILAKDREQSTRFISNCLMSV